MKKLSLAIILWLACCAPAWAQALAVTANRIKEAPSAPSTCVRGTIVTVNGTLYLGNNAGACVAITTAPAAAPTDATYITQTPNGTLSAEQAMSALATGLVKNTTTTGVLSIAVAGTDYAAPTSGSTLLAGNGAGGFTNVTSSSVSGANVTLGGTLAVGDVTGGTYNKVTITAPATGSTLTIADGKTATFSNSITIAGTDSSTLNVGGGGALGTAAFKNTGTSGNTVPLLDAANTFSAAQTVTSLTATGGAIYGSGSHQIGWLGRSLWFSPSDGVMRLDSSGATTPRIALGGTSSSFPALKRSSDALETRLADDSAYTTHRALTFSVNNACVIRSGSGTPEGSVTGNVCDLYLRTDGGASTTLYVKESGASTNTGWAAK